MNKKFIKRANLAFFVFCLLAGAVSAQTRDDSYWFFGKAKLAERKTISISELNACMLGDNLKPSARGKFKSEITATALNQSHLLETGKCDVALAFDDRPDGFERVKANYAGFAIYKIAGNNLELVYAPPANAYVAVGRMELASEETLEKANIAGCGYQNMRDLFRPTKRTWKNWMDKYVDFESLKTPRELELENALLYGCDVWIFTNEDYERFSKKYGSKYPLFDITPENPVLTRRK